MPYPPSSRPRAFLAFLGWLVFVVYGSLVPFDQRDLTLQQGIEVFRHIPYLRLGLASRADWIANILLYIPLAFLGCAWAVGARAGAARRLLGVLLVSVVCLATAVAVEFTQVFFAPRTVSLNDLLAETIGTVAGVVLWALARSRMAQLWEDFARGGHASLVAMSVVYLLAYVALALFPYDFVVSTAELEWKLASGSQAWLVVGACGLRCAARLAGEVAAIAPLGFLLALTVPGLNRWRLFLASLMLGLVLEGLQLLLASGISQGLSVLLRGLGLLAGAVAGSTLRRHGAVPIARLAWRLALLAALPYGVLLAALGGWLDGPWLPWSAALARLADQRWMPFYYHYYTSEPVALASLLAQATMYAPIGLALWARHTSRGGKTRHGALRAGLWAAALAVPIELGKLLAPAEHPDLTDALIAFAGAGLSFALMRWIEHASTGGGPRPVNSPPPPSSATAASPPVVVPAASSVLPAEAAPPRPRPVGMLVSLVSSLVALAGILVYPMGRTWLVLALVAWGALIWRRPSWWLLVIPALLPTLDLSPLTGRLLLDELDLLVLVTVAVGYWRGYPFRPLPWPHPLLPLAVGLLWLSWLVSTARGVWPIPDLSTGTVPSSHSSAEAWMVGKGLLWALLLVPLLRRISAPGRGRAQRRVLDGLTAGLVLVTLAVLWERHVFVGLWDFDSVFRVTGTFSSMNTGGAYIEAFIAFAFPILSIWVVRQRSWAGRLAGIAAVAGGSYAMLVTFSRGGYAGLMAGLTVVLVGGMISARAMTWRRVLTMAGLTAATVVVAVPVLSGGFARQRLGRVAQDLAVREALWTRALALMDGGPLTALLGMGFGKYPSAYLFGTGTERMPTTFNLGHEQGNAFLRLGSGEPMFLDQRVRVRPGAHYTLSARLRAARGDAELDVALCEKALLYSFACQWYRLPPSGPPATWSQVEARVDNRGLGTGGHWPHPPVLLSLHNPGGGAVIDVDDISLRAQDGQELVANGDFSQGTARWLMVTDQDPGWHIHQQLLEVYFAQGVLGLTALAVLLLATAMILVPAVRRGDSQATALAGAIVAFLTVGLTGSTLDTARLSMVFYLGAFAAALLHSTRSSAQGSAMTAPGAVRRRHRAPRPERAPR